MLLRRWNGVAQQLLLAMALLSIPLAIAEAVRGDLMTTDRRLLDVSATTVWATFTVDLVVRTFLLPSPRALIRNDKSSIAIVVLGLPMIPLQGAFGFLRLLRPLLRIAAFGTEIVTEARHVLTRHAFAFVAYVTLFTWWTSAALVLVCELGRSFRTIGDGMWWSAVTMATVGYGDLSPETLAGRAVAVGTMVVGIGSFSVMTAKLFEVFTRSTAEPPSLSTLDQPV